MKLRRKLLSAGFALGATALTLTTSTFAWYTSNRDVTAADVTAITSSSVDTSSLYISAAESYASNTQGASATSFSPYTTTATPSVISHGDIEPLQYVSTDRTYTTLAGAVPSTNSVVEYVLRFQVPNNTAATSIYASRFEVSNSVEAATSQQMALFNNTNYTDETNVGILKAGNYNVDVLHALKLTILAKPVTFVPGTGEADGSFSVATDSASWQTKIIDLDGYAKTAKDVNMNSTVDAETYYEKALGTTLTKPANYLSEAKAVYAASQAQANSTNSVLFSVPANVTYMEVRFTFWLDGWDEFCYDTCRQQGFTAGIDFTTEDTHSILKSWTARSGKAADPTDIYNVGA